MKTVSVTSPGAAAVVCRPFGLVREFSSAEDVERGKRDRNDKDECQQSPQPAGLRSARLALQAGEVADQPPVSFLNHPAHASP